MPPRPASLKARALQWLAQREHSPQELRDKLLRLLARQQPSSADDPDEQGGFGSATAPATADATPNSPEADVDALLQWLVAKGYLSGERFIESRVNARQARYGNLRIRHELQQHGLQLDISMRQALQSSEEQRAREVWQRKFGHAAPDARHRLQQLRFLAGRGFSMAVVGRVVPKAARAVAIGDEDCALHDDTTP